MKGHVSDVNQELLIGVSIQEKGTSNGIITDVNGGFSLEVSPKATLVVSYVGVSNQKSNGLRYCASGRCTIIE